MKSAKARQQPIRLLLTLSIVSCLGLACATVDNTAIAAQKAAPKNADAPVYYWYDGDKKREIVVATDQVADFSSDAVIKDANRVTKSDASATNSSAVFVDKNSGINARALPGGVLVRFKEVTTREQADIKLQPFSTRTVRAIGGSGKSWLVQSEPGMASLELANEIYESGVVQSAAPNWYRKRATK